MYIPRHYQEEDKRKAVSFMREYNFAIIVSMSEDRPIATHIPFCVEESGEEIVLISHIAKANRHWESFGGKDLVIFSEPHAYVSPRHYDKEQNVPTWNYLAVHAYGAVRILEEIQEKFDLMHKMIKEFEPQYLAQWDTLDEKYRSGMINGIVAFEMSVSKLDFKKKLSQNKTEVERQRIINTFEDSRDENQRSIARWMRERD